MYFNDNDYWDEDQRADLGTCFNDYELDCLAGVFENAGVNPEDAKWQMINDRWDEE